MLLSKGWQKLVGGILELNLRALVLFVD